MSYVRRFWPLALGVLGLAVSVYLVATHYLTEQVPLACDSSGLVNCEQVTTSAESMLGPVPVALMGIVCSAAGWRSSSCAGAHRQRYAGSHSWPGAPRAWCLCCT